MRIHSLSLEDFKNLKNFTVDFDKDSPYSVLLGENGAGKSNLLEAISLIFRSIDLDSPSPFGYAVDYSCRGRVIHAESSAGARTQAWLVDETGSRRKLTKREFMSATDGEPTYRPAFVFGYYSGQSDRMHAPYQTHRDRYYQYLIRSKLNRNTEDVDAVDLRRLFFAENLHGHFALIAFFMNEGEAAELDREFLRDHLQIEALDSVLVSLRHPSWPGQRDGDPRFWQAVGEVQEFLSRLYSASLPPLRMPRRVPVDLGRAVQSDHLHLFLPSVEALRSVYRDYGDQYAFFAALESMHLSSLLADMRTRVRLVDHVGGGAVTFRDLSEGEQQLLLVLGLLKFTARSEALFLLDEPDTHLNPLWSTSYLSFLDRFIEDRASCHVIMATHDPLVFAGLEAEQVTVFRRAREGQVYAERPLRSPRGMGIPAILSSDIFKLPSGGLDKPTLDLLERQHRLVIKADLSADEQAELDRVNGELDALEFWKDDRDPLYREFVTRFLPMYLGQDDHSVAEPLSLEDLEQRNRLLAEVASEVAAVVAKGNDAG